jgi:hypothetical protein
VKEVIMSKHLQLTESRLVCLGGARACTNAPGGKQELEPDFIQRYV